MSTTVATLVVDNGDGGVPLNGVDPEKAMCTTHFGLAVDSTFNGVEAFDGGKLECGEGKGSHGAVSMDIGGGSDIVKQLVSTNGLVCDFIFNTITNKTRVYVGNNHTAVKGHDIPNELQAVHNKAEFEELLKNAFVRVSQLSNGDFKVYLHQRGVGGVQRGDGSPFGNLLTSIRKMMELRHKTEPPLKAFISYAWEDMSTPEGAIANSKLQNWLEMLRDDLQQAGVSVFLDIGDMHGNMKSCMEENLKGSDVILTIHTPRFKARATSPQTNLGFEYGLTVEKAKTIPKGIFPLHFQGEYEDTFGKRGAADELKDMKQFLIRDCRKPETYEATMVETQRPLGIIPAVYGVDCDDDKEYQRLVRQWQWEKLTRLPPPNPDFTGRGELLQQLKASFDDVSCAGQPQTICGLGGVGKSELALSFAHHSLKSGVYTVIRWLHSEGDSLKLEFVQMASEFGIDTKGMSDSEVVKAVYTRLSGAGGWLLIFDNTTDYESLEPFLPQTVKGGQHILVTSRSQQWKNCVSLDGFSEKDAVSYIQRVLVKVTQEQAVELARELGCLPLALSHSVAYMKHTSISVGAYLQVYKEKGIELLSVTKKNTGGEVKYPHNVLTTWTMSMEKVANKSPDAVKLLAGCAFLAPDDIPLKLFSHKDLLGDSLRVYEAVGVLRDFSLVDSASKADHIKVHRLVQAVVRQQETADPDKLSLLLKSLSSVVSHNHVKAITQEDFKWNQLLLPHAESLVVHLDLCANPKCQLVVAETLAESLLVVCATTQEMGNYVGWKKAAQHLLSVQERHLGQDHPDIAVPLTHLANALGKLGNTESKRNILERSLKIQEHHYGPDHPQVAVTLTNLANALGDLGDTESKRKMLERSLIIDEHHYGPDHPDIAVTLTNLANALGELGDTESSKKMLERSLKIKEHHYGPNHPEVATILTNLASALGELGDTKSSKEMLERSLKIEEHHYGPNHPQIATTLMNLANTLGELGDIESKRKMLERTLKIQEHHYGPDHPQLAKTLTSLAIALGELRDTESARKMLERSLKIQEHHYGPDHPQVALTLMNLANVLGELGDTESKRKLLERSLKIKEHHYSPDHPQVSITLYNLSIACEKTGDVALALEYATRAHSNYNNSPQYKTQPLVVTFATNMNRLKQKISTAAPNQNLLQQNPTPKQPNLLHKLFGSRKMQH